ncbi:MAG TPA: putative lipid II flippase FtsW [Candidatus Ornithocaccomicrobium faecavium]|uniref:Probable peptidoglycan glycosyltransferase FtsW n=1 Tax=Candidatus Ornithocaccomicrobium faecavium TaxID=2840890 RepID=A0A9D1PAE9_9FIRM|nr:putative lipid II flippase FtsW [Clostridiales bacterium]HIV28628.1 putative lipid II flippase FtsW [Candidatus Ornithocaccomicrobium faecavium]
MLISFAALLAMGLIVLYAASFYNAQDQGNPLSEVLSQLMGVGVGAVGMALVLRVDYRVLQNSAVCLGLVALSLLLLVLVAIPGVGKSVNGSRRWLSLGFVGFQPSELAKYSMVAYMARALAARRRDLQRLFRGLAPLFLVPGAMFLLILQQPNLSTAGSIVIVAALMVMLAGAKWSHLSLIGACGAAVGAFYALSEEYRRERLMSFRDPWKYLSDEGYQLAQSLLAFGSGGLFGMGLGRGRQKYAFLPYPESDFIFAVVGEDMGLVGCLLILGLFVAFEFFAFRIALRCPDRFGSLLAGGIACMIGVQCVLNVAVVIGLIPTTGLPLPFFSAGGTSVSIVMCAVAVLLNVARRSGA